MTRKAVDKKSVKRKLDLEDRNSNKNGVGLVDGKETKKLRSQSISSHSEGNQKNQVLPLNSDVVKRIRLNIGSGLTSKNGQPLKNIIKSKLANVMKVETPGKGQKTQKVQRAKKPDDLMVLNEHWSELYCLYQSLIKSQTQTQQQKTKKSIVFDPDSWNQFDTKMSELREIFHKINENSNKKKIQNSRQKKKIKEN